jgi:predicted ATPase/DNA-binding winged helix-turn-helix (wHTH) protein
MEGLGRFPTSASFGLPDTYRHISRRWVSSAKGRSLDINEPPFVQHLYFFGPFKLNVEERLLYRDGVQLELGSRSMGILTMLVERAGEVVDKKELLAHTWPNIFVEESSLRVHLAGLRKVLGEGQEGARYITNIHGRGYCFVAPVTHSSARNRDPLAAPNPAKDAAVAPDRLHGVPVRLGRMVGREETLSSLRNQVLVDRFVTVVGPGGMGKTTIAVEVAHALSEELNGAVVFLDLGMVAEPGLIVGALACALGLLPQGGDPLHTVLSFLERKRLLLVFDNCEHVIEAVAALAEAIFRQAPQAYILATSRESLRVAGERIHQLAPLGTPEGEVGLSAAEALAFPAIRLFVERALASDTEFQLTDALAPLVVGICRRLDGIALAIELVASRVWALGVRAIAELLDRRLTLNWQGQRTALPRHQTLGTLLDWSYNLLSEEEQRVLRRLSVFLGEFTLDDAQAVLAEADFGPEKIIEAVVNLIAKSLVSVNTQEGPVHYRLLETTRAYARPKLEEDDDANRLSRRHALHFMALLKSAHRSKVGALCLGNVREALEWSFSPSGDPELGIDLVIAVTPLLMQLSFLADCHRWSERALGSLTKESRGTERELALLNSLAISAMHTRGQDSEVRAAIQRALDLAKELGLQAGARHQELLAALLVILVRTADLEGLLRVAKENASVARATAHPGRQAIADWMLGVGHHLLGNQAAALRHCEAAFAQDGAAQRVPRNYFGYDNRVAGLCALARTLWLRGSVRRAVEIARQAIDDAALLEHPVTMCIAHIYTTPVFVWSGELDTAEEVVARLIENAVRYSFGLYTSIGRGLLGDLMLARGKREAGMQLLSRSVEVLGVEQHVLHTGIFAARMAEELTAQGNLDQALVLIDTVIKQWDRTGGRSFDMPDMLRIKGRIVLSQPGSDPEVGQGWLLRSLDLARTQNALSWELRTALTLAQLEPPGEQRLRALERLEEIYGRFTEGFDTPDVAAARRLLEGECPPDRALPGAPGSSPGTG